MQGFTRLRRWLQRRPTAAHWLAVAAVAAVAALGVAAAQRSASSAASSWGEPTLALQAQVGLAAGTEPSVGQLAAVEVPAHLAPADALTDPQQVSVLGRFVPAGGLLSTADLAEPTAVPAGLAGVPIASPRSAPAVAAGTRLQLLLFGEVDPYDGQVPPPSSVIGTLVSRSADGWVVAVAPGDVAAVAQAEVAGRILPVLVGG